MRGVERFRSAIRSRGVQLLVGTVVFAYLLLRGLYEMGGPAAVEARFGWATAGVLIPVQALVAVSPMPGELVALANSAVYGFWLGFVFNWIGWMLAAFLEYGLFHRLARDFDADRAFARLPEWLRRFPVEHPLFQIVGRFLPYGGHLVGVSSGAFRVPLWRYGWCAALGLVPGALLISALANGLWRGLT